MRLTKQNIYHLTLYSRRDGLHILQDNLKSKHCLTRFLLIMASGPITSWQIDGETVETVSTFIFWAPKALQMVIAAMKLNDAYSLEEKL